jgi:hypothetical protein
MYMQPEAYKSAIKKNLLVERFKTTPEPFVHVPHSEVGQHDGERFTR